MINFNLKANFHSKELKAQITYPLLLKDCDNLFAYTKMKDE